MNITGGRKLVQPQGLLRLRAGEPPKLGDNFPKSWDHGIVEYNDAGEWRPLDGFKTHEQGGHQEFHIELLSNVIQGGILKSHLTLRTGKMPACTRAHRGLDEIGVAMRRTADGQRVPIECDPGRCAFRRLHLAYENESAVVSKQILDEDYEAFPWLAKAAKGAVCACKPDVNLIFALLLPDGSDYAPGKYCVFHSVADSNHGRFMARLGEFNDQTLGQLKGLRLKLVFSPFKSRYGNPTPSWDLVAPDDVDFNVQMQQAAERRLKGRIDYDGLVASVDETALALVGDEKSLMQAAREQGVNPLEFVRDELQDYSAQRAYLAEYVDPASVTLINQHPLVIRMAQRLKISYPRLVKMPMVFGDDLYRCMAWLKKQAEARPAVPAGPDGKGAAPAKEAVYVGDIWAEYEATLPGFGAVAANPAPGGAAGQAVVADSEPIEAEFTEVVDEPEAPRTLEQMLDAAKGKSNAGENE